MLVSSRVWVIVFCEVFCYCQTISYEKAEIILVKDSHGIKNGCLSLAVKVSEVVCHRTSLIGRCRYVLLASTIDQ